LRIDKLGSANYAVVTIMGVRLKNDYASPIGGWQHTDAQISSEAITVWSCNELVEAVIARRRQNPRFGLSLDHNLVKHEVMTQNATRMQSINGGNHYLIQDDAMPGPAPGQQGFTQPRRARPSAAGNNRVRSIAAGVGTLLDWLGQGGEPVDLTLAEGRAQVCNDCPQNKPGDWLALFTEPVANKIRSQLAIKNDMELRTSVDDSLQVCQACLCPIKLKCWVPIGEILKHTSEETKAKLDPRCWITKEK